MNFELRKKAEALVIKELAPSVLEWMDGSGENHGYVLDDIETELTSAFRMGGNGYELAKELDDFGPDAELVELLDHADFMISQKMRELTRQEIIEKEIKPRYALGDVVKLGPYWTKSSETFDAKITAISDDGRYTVNCKSLGHVEEGLGTHGLIIEWKDLEDENATIET